MSNNRCVNAGWEDEPTPVTGRIEPVLSFPYTFIGSDCASFVGCRLSLNIESFTILGWVQLLHLSGREREVFSIDSPSSQVCAIWGHQAQRTLWVSYTCKNGISEAIDTKLSIPEGHFHLAVTYGSTGFTLYVNGEKRKFLSETRPLLDPAEKRILIGRSRCKGNGNVHCTGQIYGVSIYAQHLNEERIRREYAERPSFLVHLPDQSSCLLTQPQRLRTTRWTEVTDHIGQRFRLGILELSLPQGGVVVVESEDWKPQYNGYQDVIINLYDNQGNIVLHFNPRGWSRNIVMDTQALNGGWAGPIFFDNLNSFKANSNNSIAIANEQTHFEIYVNKQLIYKFGKRFNTEVASIEYRYRGSPFLSDPLMMRVYSSLSQYMASQ